MNSKIKPAIKKILGAISDFYEVSELSTRKKAPLAAKK
jgi:hypothetical protein